MHGLHIRKHSMLAKAPVYSKNLNFTRENMLDPIGNIIVAENFDISYFVYKHLWTLGTSLLDGEFSLLYTQPSKPTHSAV